MAVGLYDKNRSLLWNLSRDFSVVLFGAVIAFICGFIRLVTLTVFDKHKITRFKIWRIRRLTALKLWFFHKFPNMCRMLDLYGYMVVLDRKFSKKKEE